MTKNPGLRGKGRNKKRRKLISPVAFLSTTSVSFSCVHRFLTEATDMGLLMSHADASISQYSGKHIFSTTHLRNIFVMTFECFILKRDRKSKTDFF